VHTSTSSKVQPASRFKDLSHAVPQTVERGLKSGEIQGENVGGEKGRKSRVDIGWRQKQYKFRNVFYKLFEE